MLYFPLGIWGFLGGFFFPNFCLEILFSFLFFLQFSSAEFIPKNLICLCSELARAAVTDF